MIVVSEKTIILYEKYPGVRFVLAKSLSILEDEITVHTSSDMQWIKMKINQNDVDLLITELSQSNPEGIEISSYARRLDPDIKIIWITSHNCSVFRRQKNQLGNITCIEKPLNIRFFRQNVRDVLEV